MSQDDTKPDVELFSSSTEITVPTWHELDTTPNDALRELVDHFRGMAEQMSAKEFEIAYTKAADELEELINDE